MSLLPVQVYGLEVPPGQDVLTPARQEFDVPNAVVSFADVQFNSIQYPAHVPARLDLKLMHRQQCPVIPYSLRSLTTKR